MRIAAVGNGIGSLRLHWRFASLVMSHAGARE